MTRTDEVFEAMRNCVCDNGKCEDCPYHFKCMKVGTGVKVTVPIPKLLGLDVVEALKDRLPAKAEVGGIPKWGTRWYECGACRGAIDPNDKYCRHCGRELKWDEDEKADH